MSPAKKTKQIPRFFPAGTYFIGDLDIVLKDEEKLDRMFEARVASGESEDGMYHVKDGTPEGMWYGYYDYFHDEADVIEDDDGRKYRNEGGGIGCVSMEYATEGVSTDGGHVVVFKKPFSPKVKEDCVQLGKEVTLRFDPACTCEGGKGAACPCGGDCDECECDPESDDESESEDDFVSDDDDDE